ncbi:MAG: NADH-quinone oxidoreductase subunit NuoK [Nitrososphaerota archaeon]|nr:NADH-quinone oxidoreductase subunit NuoK [Nitrososphaerota archaeon]
MALAPLIYVMFSSAIFAVGIYVLATKRNLIKQLIGIELLINAAHLNFVSFAASNPVGLDPYAISFVLLSLGAGAAIIAVAILLAVHVYRQYGTLDLDQLRRLRR